MLVGSIAKSCGTNGKMGILHACHWKQLCVHSSQAALQQQSSLEPPCLCSSFGLFISKTFESFSIYGCFQKLLSTQIYTVLLNPCMYVTSTNLLLNGKSLRSQSSGKQICPTVVDCTWRICSSYFLLPASECWTGKSGLVLKIVV